MEREDEKRILGTRCVEHYRLCTGESSLHMVLIGRSFEILLLEVLPSQLEE